MKHKPSLMFMICAAVAAVLIIGSSVLVVLSFQKLETTDRKLKAREQELAGIYRLDPFPSKANVIREKRNDNELTRWYSNLVAQASEGQLDLREQRPSRFMELLGTAQRRLLTNAQDRVEIPDNFAFGFERYFSEGSRLPEPAHVPRLTQQLVIIDRLCRILFAEGVDGITAVTRDVFEGGARTENRRRRTTAVSSDAGELKPGALYAKLSFTLQFDATELTTMGVLNRLSRDRLFIVPTSLLFSKTADDVRLYALPVSEPSAEAPDIVAPKEELSRQERMVCGLPLETPMHVTMKLDVYRFRRGPDA